MAEKAALRAAELERERAHDVLANTLDRRLVMLEQERRGIAKELEQNVARFRAEHQAKESRREFDLSDPSGKRDARPARLGDEDPRTGVSSAQKFDGEDLDAGARRVAQTAQAAAWYAAQTAEKEARLTEARLAKEAHKELLKAQEQYQNQAAEAQAAARRAHAASVAAENARLATSKRDAADSFKRAEFDAENAERLRNENDMFLTENPLLATSALAPGRRVRPDHWKGASAAERAAVADAQRLQRLEKAEASKAEAAAEAFAASHYENTRRALEMNAERVEQFKAEQRAAVLATVLGQRAEKHESDAADRAERFQTGRFGEAYFAGFGASAR